MTGTLKQYFPMLHERESLLRQIQSTPALRQQFDRWQPYRQKEFLDFCTGVRGVKLLYDSFFKEILSPEYTPERLNVTAHSVPSNDASRCTEMLHSQHFALQPSGFPCILPGNHLAGWRGVNCNN